VALSAQPSPFSGTATDREAGDSRGSLRVELRLVALLVVLLMLTQRVGLPVGGSVIPLALPLSYAFAAVTLMRGLLTVSRLRAELFVVAISACLLATVAVSWLGATWQLSMSSLFYLIALYLPWLLRVRAPHGGTVVAHAGRTFVRVMLVLAGVGIVQLVAQLTGVWDWEDYLALVVPADYMVPDYNFSNELAYGVGTFKSTAFVLLEPSFLSQFCALAILVGIMLRVPMWQLLLLGAGLFSAVSGTGLILLAVGAALLLVRAPQRLRPGYLLGGGLIAGLFYLSPVATFLISRQDEVGTEGTSGNARFAAPFEYAWEGLVAEPTRFLVGAGSGSVQRIIGGSRVAGVDILYSTLPKLAFEYGIIAGGLFALFLVLAIVDRAPWRVIPGALVVMVFLLSGALLQPQTAVLAWLLAGIGATDRPAEDRLPRKPAVAS
jgi:hypothetical protein